MKYFFRWMFVFLSAPLFATSFIVPPATGAQTLGTDETGVVETVGSILVTGVGVTIDGDGASLNNAGLIYSTTAYSLDVTGNNVEIINSGTISAPAYYGNSISSANNFILQNSGQISAYYYTLYVSSSDDGQIINSGNLYGSTETAIFLNTCNGTLINNSGTISTGASGSYSVYLTASPSTQIINNGTITAGSGGYAVDFVNSQNSSLVNNGTIFTSGLYGVVIVSSSNVHVTNNGNISSAEYTVYFGSTANGSLTNNGTILGPAAVTANGATAVEIINCGTIASGITDPFDNYALYFVNSTQTLTLLQGSNIQGEIHVDTNPLNLNVETGLNVVLSITGGESFGNLGIASPYVVRGDPVIAVIDATGLAMQADVIADISDTILDGVYDHLYCYRGCAPWVMGLGSYRERKGSHTTVGYHDWQGGGMIGKDCRFMEHPISVFVGFTYVGARVVESTQTADVATVFAGLSYEGCLWNTFYELSAVGGYVNWDNKRYVMNNLVGIETAKYTINRALFTAEAAAWRNFALFCDSWHPCLLFNFRYAGLFLGSYSEHGSIADLSVKGRSVNLLTTRLETTLMRLDKGFGTVDPYVGVFGRYQVGGYRVNGTLLGSSLSFNQGGVRNLAAFVVGARSCPSWRFLKSFLNIEVSFDSASSTRVLGEGGLYF